MKDKSTLLHRLVLSIELGTVQTGAGKVDPARKFKCTTADREYTVYTTQLTVHHYTVYKHSFTSEYPVH